MIGMFNKVMGTKCINFIFRPMIIITMLGLFLTPALNSSVGEENKDQSKSYLTLERIFSSDEFRPESFGPAQWLNDSTGYLLLEESARHPGCREIVRYEMDGRRKVLVAADELIPRGESKPLRISRFTLSPDRECFLLLTNPHRHFHKTFGDFWVFELKDKNLRKLGGDVPSGSLTLATFSPDGNKIAYVRKNNIYTEDLLRCGILQITKDGSEDILNGNFDYVFEEEFFLTNGFRWSPDSQKIAYWQLDTSAVQAFHMINNTDALYPRLISFKFSKPGEKNASCRIGVVNAGGGPTRWLEVPGDPANNYIPQMDWAENSQDILFQRLNRLQNKNEVMMGDAATGRTRTIMTDTDAAWVHVVPEIHWLANGQEFLWISERDGWRHVYRVSRSGKDTLLLTNGDYDVESIEGVDEEKGWLFFVASPDNPTQRYLYRIALGGGQKERISPQDKEGTHRYRLSPDCRWAFHTYSRFGLPPITELVSLPDHKTIRILAGNDRLQNILEGLDRGKAEFFRVDIGGNVMLDAWSMLPQDFDPQKRYPVLFYVYGEPWGSTVRDAWGGSRYLWHLMLTQQGYIIMSVDNRGTRVPRGRAWRKIIYRQVGILASADQAAAVRAIIASRGYIDPDGIGVWGWSGGGAMTLNLLLRYPDLYKTGMSVAPVTDQRLYNSIYQERYMGLPSDNKDGYEKGSPLNFVHQLEGNLLFVHGTGDDNVHYQNSEVLINALIQNNKPFTMMSYPNRSHGIREGTNTTRHLYELLTRYLKENLPPGF